MIDRNSRYTRTPVVTAPDPSGAPRPLLALRVPAAPPATLTHAAGPGERLDHLAWRYYGDPSAWWRICDAADVLDPLDLLAPGRAVPVPPTR